MHRADRVAFGLLALGATSGDSVHEFELSTDPAFFGLLVRLATDIHPYDAVIANDCRCRIMRVIVGDVDRAPPQLLPMAEVQSENFHEHWPFLEGTITAIYAPGVLQQLSNRAAMFFLHQAGRVLTPGGELILTADDASLPYRALLSRLRGLNWWEQDTFENTCYGSYDEASILTPLEHDAPLVTLDGWADRIVEAQADIDSEGVPTEPFDTDLDYQPLRRAFSALLAGSANATCSLDLEAMWHVSKRDVRASLSLDDAIGAFIVGSSCDNVDGRNWWTASKVAELFRSVPSNFQTPRLTVSVNHPGLSFGPWHASGIKAKTRVAEARCMLSKLMPPNPCHIVVAEATRMGDSGKRGWADCRNNTVHARPPSALKVLVTGCVKCGTTLVANGLAQVAGLSMPLEAEPAVPFRHGPMFVWYGANKMLDDMHYDGAKKAGPAAFNHTPIDIFGWAPSSTEQALAWRQLFEEPGYAHKWLHATNVVHAPCVHHFYDELRCVLPGSVAVVHVVRHPLDHVRSVLDRIREQHCRNKFADRLGGGGGGGVDRTELLACSANLSNPLTRGLDELDRQMGECIDARWTEPEVSTWHRSTAEQIARGWALYARFLLQQRESARVEAFHIVRYEDVIEDKARVLRRLAESLGFEASEQRYNDRQWQSRGPSRGIPLAQIIPAAELAAAVEATAEYAQQLGYSMDR